MSQLKEQKNINKTINTVLETAWPQYKREAPLPPELMNLTIGYLVEEKKIYWKNGQLWKQGNYVNGKKDGEWKELYPDGQLWSQQNYINGELHGEWKDYHIMDGQQLWTQGNYVNGKQHGEWKAWWDNGQLKGVGFYIDGKKHGEWKQYYPNGQLEKIGSYIDGKKHGEWKQYYSNCWDTQRFDIKEIRNYVNGKKTW